MPYYSTVVLTIIIALTYNLFYLVPLISSQGGSYLPDIGLVFLCVVLIFALVRSGKRFPILIDKMSLMVLFYLFLVGIEIVLATLYHGQSLADGVVAARRQYFYLAFFLFMLLLDDRKKFHQLLNTMTIIVLFVFVMTIVNYIGIKVFYHPRADNWGVIRSGVERAFIPGFRLVSMVFLWQFARWLAMKHSDRLISGTLVIVFLGEHIFRQSRVALISVLIASIVMLVATRRYGLLIKSGIFMLFAILVTGVFMEKNIITEPFTTSFEEVSHSKIKAEGSWNDRLKQIMFAWNEFQEHPLLGSGSVALRVGTFEGNGSSGSEIFMLAYKSDLGYTNIIKSYGVVGIIWLVMFLWMMVSMARYAIRVFSKTSEPLLLFAAAYTVYVLISLVTLNHIMFAEDTLLLLIVVVILVQNYRNKLLESH